MSFGTRAGVYKRTKPGSNARPCTSLAIRPAAAFASPGLRSAVPASFANPKGQVSGAWQMPATSRIAVHTWPEVIELPRAPPSLSQFCNVHDPHLLDPGCTSGRSWTRRRPSERYDSTRPVGGRGTLCAIRVADRAARTSEWGSSLRDVRASDRGRRWRRRGRLGHAARDNFAARAGVSREHAVIPHFTHVKA